jgi:hypothetical protein
LAASQTARTIELIGSFGELDSETGASRLRTEGSDINTVP